MNSVHLSDVLPDRRAPPRPGHEGERDVTTVIGQERSGEAAGGTPPLPELTILRTGGAYPARPPVIATGPAVVSLRDGLDMAAAPALREQFLDALHRGPTLLVIDLARVSACDPAGLAVLVGTQRRARLLGTAMCLAGPSAPVRDVLRSTGLDRNFAIYPDVPAAVADGPGPAAVAGPVPPR
jgi:anti-sigma B factor antagonist